MTYGYGGRGNEGFWVDADRLRGGSDLGRNATEDSPHLVVSLLGTIKGEDGNRMHVFALATESGSGIKTRVLLERAWKFMRKKGRKNALRSVTKRDF